LTPGLGGEVPFEPAAAARFLLVLAEMRGTARAALLFALLLPATGIAAAPVAVDRSLVTDTDVPVEVDLQALSDFDATLSFAIVSGPAHAMLGGIGAAECTYPGGIASCTATVLYAPAAGYAGTDTFTYQVSDGSLTSNVATVTVTVTGTPLMPPPAIVPLGDTYAATVSGVVAGATVDYGDDREGRPLTVDVNGAAALEHVYVDEGSYTITVTNPSGAAATTFAHVLLAGLGDSSNESVPPGSSGTLELPDLTATLTRTPGASDDAIMVGAVYPATLPGFFIGGLFGHPLAAFDLRVIAPGDGDSATVAFGYADPGAPAVPTLTFLDPETQAFAPVAGSTLVAPSLSIDVVARRITVVFDQTSRPTLQSLRLTRLVVSDLAFPRVTQAAGPSTTRRGSAVLIRSGQTVSCPADGPGCSASIRARVQQRSAGRARFRLAAGRTREIAFVLSKKAARLLRRRPPLDVTVAIRVAIAKRPPRTVTGTFTLAPRVGS